MRPHTLPKSHRRLGSAATCSVLGCSECAWAHYDRIDKRETMDRPPLLPTCVRQSAVFCALASGALSQNQSRAERTGQRIYGAGALSLGALSLHVLHVRTADLSLWTKHPMLVIPVASIETLFLLPPSPPSLILPGAGSPNSIVYLNQLSSVSSCSPSPLPTNT